jgi:polar amino acid transport system permease protein
MLDSPELIVAYVVSPIFVRGAFTTLLVTLLSMTLGIVVGLVVALIQQARMPPLQILVTAYLWLFRGTPVLFQIIFVFYVLPGFGILLSGLTSGVLALSMNEGAYTAEIFRSGLQAVSRGQRTAGRSLGMREWQVMRYIVLPQALRVVVPPLGNQFLGMLKLSALVSTIAVQDLLLVANQTASASFHYFEALSAAGIYYLVMTTLFMFIQFRIERWAGRRQRVKPTTWTQRLLGMTADAGRIR